MFALRMVVKCHKAFKNKRNWLATLLQISQHGLVSFTTAFSSEFNSSVPWHQQIILPYYCLSCNNLVLMWGAALTKTAAQCNASFQSQFYQCTQIFICKHSDYSSAGLQLSKPLTQHGTEQNHPSQPTLLRTATSVSAEVPGLSTHTSVPRSPNSFSSAKYTSILNLCFKISKTHKCLHQQPADAFWDQHVFCWTFCLKEAATGLRLWFSWRAFHAYLQCLWAHNLPAVAQSTLFLMKQM